MPLLLVYLYWFTKHLLLKELDLQGSVPSNQTFLHLHCHYLNLFLYFIALLSPSFSQVNPLFLLWLHLIYCTSWYTSRCVFVSLFSFQVKAYWAHLWQFLQEVASIWTEIPSCPRVGLNLSISKLPWFLATRALEPLLIVPSFQGLIASKYSCEANCHLLSLFHESHLSHSYLWHRETQSLRLNIENPFCLLQWTY